MRPTFSLVAALVASTLGTGALAQDAEPAGPPLPPWSPPGRPPGTPATPRPWPPSSPRTASIATRPSTPRTRAQRRGGLGGDHRSRIPESRLEVVDAFQCGDRFAVRWVFHGTPERFGPIEATGRSFEVPTVSIIDLEQGLIARVTDYYTRRTCFGSRP